MIVIANQNLERSAGRGLLRKVQNPNESIISTLRRCLDCLEASAEQPRMVGPMGMAVEQWEGDGYLYVEIKSARDLGPDLDVNFHGKRVLIRLDVTSGELDGSIDES